MIASIEVLPIVFATWLFHAAVGVGLASIVIAFSGTKLWSPLDLLAVIIPFAAWFALAGFCGIVPKSMTNILVEPLLLAFCLPIAAAIRVALRASFPGPLLRLSLLALLSVVGVAIYFVVPTMGE